MVVTHFISRPQARQQTFGDVTGDLIETRPASHRWRATGLQGLVQGLIRCLELTHKLPPFYNMCLHRVCDPRQHPGAPLVTVPNLDSPACNLGELRGRFRRNSLMYEQSHA